MEPTLFESLADNEESGPVPEQTFGEGPKPVQEDEQVAAQGILAELVLNQSLQASEPFAHVDGMPIDEDPAPVLQKSHWASPSKRRTIPPGSSTTMLYGVPLEEVDRSLVGKSPANYREERA